MDNPNPFAPKRRAGQSKDIQAPAVPDKLATAWSNWKANPTVPNFQEAYKVALPTIKNVLTSIGANNSPSLQSAAKVTFLKAMQSYDPSYGTKLSTHIFSQMRPLQREAFSYDTLYVPERTRYDLKAYKAAYNELIDTLGREPNEDELTDKLGISRKKLKEVRAYDNPVVYESSILSYADNTGQLPAATSNKATLRDEMVYGSLNDIDKTIVDMKRGTGPYTEPLSVSIIAKRLRLTPSAVSQRLAKVDAILSELEDSDA